NNYVDTNPNAPGSIYNGHFLLGIGQYHGPASAFKWDTSVDNKASVYTDRVQDANGAVHSAIATSLQLKVNILGEPIGRNFVGLANTADAGTPTNVAVGQQITVTGNNNMYISEVDQLTADNITAGNAPIVSIGDEPGNVYVMAKLNGAAADVQAFLDALSADVGPADSEFAKLHSLYDSQFGAGGFNALFKFPNFAGAKVFSIETTGTTGVSVDQLAAVPEPAAMGLMAFGALGLLARRRRDA
ncbi:MAG TPA: PEP-CTERM sorting domain-containing protein, partial [Tepidisphaeraceae bacterium]|nr:PEP-CTERM sorting domain-containing protein [Tepidisphaeraceae bacterium]